MSMTRAGLQRRRFVTLVGAAMLSPHALHAQTKMRRIGILLVGSREPFWSLFSGGLRDLGYVEGRDVTFEFRSGQGNLQALPGLAAELVGLNVDLIVASETPAVQAAKRATTEVPIVMAPSGDPVGTGLIASLARPGGNITGLSAATAELAGKSLELIREILPTTKRVAALADPQNSFTSRFSNRSRPSREAFRSRCVPRWSGNRRSSKRPSRQWLRSGWTR